MDYFHGAQDEVAWHQESELNRKLGEVQELECQLGEVQELVSERDLALVLEVAR
jgi:hypothetical protein